jgi:hypothetical protein
MSEKSKAIKAYIEDNCTLLERPRCECCGDFGEIYSDSLAGEDYCYDCLVKDLEKDPEALKDYNS